MRPDRTIGAVTALVVGAVTALAFAQSFHALRTFAEAQQVVPARWGWMFAATIDGFVLAALLTPCRCRCRVTAALRPGRCGCLP